MPYDLTVNLLVPVRKPSKYNAQLNHSELRRVRGYLYNNIMKILLYYDFLLVSGEIFRQAHVKIISHYITFFEFLSFIWPISSISGFPREIHHINVRESIECNINVNPALSTYHCFSLVLFLGFLWGTRTKNQKNRDTHGLG